MWPIFTILYNSILVLFIAVHLLVGALITFLVGLFIGIYLCQNYEIPKIEEPFKLWSYFVKFLEERRKPGGISILQLSSKSSPSATLQIPSQLPSSLSDSRDNLNTSTKGSRGSTPLPEIDKDR